jgi:hypothetical protein
MTTLITEQDSKQIADLTAFLTEKVSSLTITSEDEYQGAGYLIKNIKVKAKDIEAARVERKEPHLEASRAVDAEFKPVLDMAKEKIAFLEQAGRDYRRKVEAEQAAELKRLEDEANAKRAALEDQAVSIEEKRNSLLRLADEYAAAGNVVEAQKCRTRAEKYATKFEAKVEQINTVVTARPTIAAPKNTLKGFNTRVYWKARITDKKKALEFCLKNSMLALINFDESALNNMAMGTKGPSTIEGVEFYQV